MGVVWIVKERCDFTCVLLLHTAGEIAGVMV